MATKSSVGWIILVLALAVPGILFHQWYTHLDLEKKRALTTKVRLKDTDLFRNSPKQEKLVNPMASESAPEAARAATAAPVPMSGQVAASPTASLPAGGERPPSSVVADASPEGARDGAAPGAKTDLQPLPAASPAGSERGLDAPAPAADSVPAPTPADDPEAPKSSSALHSNPFQAWRDPTLSPHDLVEIERLELEKQQAIEELRNRALHGSKKPRKTSTPIDRLIDLQGIVSVEGGNKAIVNNEMVSEGDVVKTKAGPVKVRRITLQKVKFEYSGNKFFFKAVNR